MKTLFRPLNVSIFRVGTVDVPMLSSITNSGQTDIEPERNSIQTLVAKKSFDGQWSLAAFQNTRAQYIGRPEQS